MLHLARQVIRGCGTLPYVGEHPGTPFVAMFIILGAVAGGWIGMGMMAAVFLPIHLLGAYDRAEYSDRIEQEWREVLDKPTITR